MNKIFLIIKREYLTRVRKRIFIITTLLAPIGIAVLTIMPLLVSNVSSENKKIGVIDKSNNFIDKLKNENSIEFVYLNEDYAKAKTEFKNAGLSGILYVPEDFNMYEGSGVEYYSDEQLGLRSQSEIGDQMSKITREIKLGKIDLTPELIDQLSKDVSIKAIVIGESGEKEGNAGIATMLGYVMGFVIYIVMLLYGTQVMRGVMEEKTNRIAEVMISSVKPFQLMMGKIIGIGMVGLTQFIIWIILIALVQAGIGMFYGHEIAQVQQNGMQMQQMQGSGQSMAANKIVKIMSSASQLPWLYLIACFLFFFIGGYLLYAALFAAVGAAAGDEADQSLTFIVTLPVIISIILMTNSLEQPNGTLAVVASMIPFSAPIIMCSRLPFNPPLWQVIVSMISLVIGFVFTTWLAGKIYRTGILMYGKKVTIRELGKWLTYKN